MGVITSNLTVLTTHTTTGITTHLVTTKITVVTTTPGTLITLQLLPYHGHHPHHHDFHHLHYHGHGHHSHHHFPIAAAIITNITKVISITAAATTHPSLGILQTCLFLKR